jgi:hypothetical protein
VQGFSLQECLNADIYFADSFPQAFTRLASTGSESNLERALNRQHPDSRPGVA